MKHAYIGVKSDGERHEVTPWYASESACRRAIDRFCRRTGWHQTQFTIYEHGRRDHETIAELNQMGLV